MNAFRSILASIVAASLLLVAAPASANHDDPPIACVGDEGPELPGVCYDPDDYDGCDAYLGLTHGNQVCLVPALPNCVGAPPEFPGACFYPREDCQLFAQAGATYVCVLPISASTAGAAADPWPLCQDLILGPDILFGVCVDPTRDDCMVWTYSYYQQTCYVPGLPAASASAAPRACVGNDGQAEASVCYDPGNGDGCDAHVTFHHGNHVCILPETKITAASASAAPPRAHCEQLLVGPDIDQGVCYDLDGEYVDGMNCVVWWYSTYSTGQDRCYVPYPPGAVALGTASAVCVGNDGQAEASVCYDPDDGDGCDAHVTFHHGNHVCLVPDVSAIAVGASAAAPQPVCKDVITDPDAFLRVCADPTGECSVWTFSSRTTTCYAPGAGGLTVAAGAPPRAYCQQVLVGPDIDQGVCYDLDGEEVNGRECHLWWYAKYGTGTTTCYVPVPVTSGIDGTCYHLPDGADVRSVCHDTTRDTCQVWAEGTGRDRCLT